MEITTRTNSAAHGDGAIESNLNKAAAGLHNAVEKMVGAAGNAVQKAEPAIDRVAQLAHHAVDKMADVAAPTASWISERGEKIKKTQSKLVADTSEYVSSNPWKSLGFALAAGYLISRITR
jgi:ElaB/YqjD/DUF883 family membrane-anchored ribosome-binding protein